MLQDHKGMGSSTSAMDAQPKLLNSVKRSWCSKSTRCSCPQAMTSQAAAAQSTKTYHGALLVVMDRNPLSYCLLGL